MSARILVVDDDPWILRMVTASLRKRQFTVDTARDGRQALDRVRAHVPAVIITDVMMPGMDGWTLVKQLRQDPRLATIPVIFLTALAKDEARLRALGLTDDDYLSKPFRFEDLEKRVDAALQPHAGASGPHPAGRPPSGPMPAATAPGPPVGYPPPPGTTPNSGLHPLYPPGPTHNSGVHPLPGPYGYPPQQGQYPGQYPPQPPGQYPGQYPPPPPGQYPGQYPPQQGQYPPQQGQYPP
ncbi:MAG: response regulator, partial [Myxococcota bacterium]